jgi:hypothetical protein
MSTGCPFTHCLCNGLLFTVPLGGGHSNENTPKFPRLATIIAVFLAAGAPFQGVSDSCRGNGVEPCARQCACALRNNPPAAACRAAAFRLIAHVSDTSPALHTRSHPTQPPPRGSPPQNDLLRYPQPPRGPGQPDAHRGSGCCQEQPSAFGCLGRCHARGRARSGAGARPLWGTRAPNRARMHGLIVSEAEWPRFRSQARHTKTDHGGAAGGSSQPQPAAAPAAAPAPRPWPLPPPRPSQAPAPALAMLPDGFSSPAPVELDSALQAKLEKLDSIVPDPSGVR